MNRLPRPAKGKRRPRERVRHVTVVLAIAAVLAAGAFGSQAYFATKPQAAAAGRASGAEEIYTGSILYMPNEGRLCRQILFDNHTGRFTDNGYVDCENAAYHGGNDPKRWSAARVQVISSGFRRR
jgi:hypothetical protein